MNNLARDQQIAILSAITEGMSLRAALVSLEPTARRLLAWRFALGAGAPKFGDQYTFVALPSTIKVIVLAKCQGKGFDALMYEE